MCLDELEARGLYQDCTDRTALAALLASAAPVSVYAGYDPTSSSLHVGNLVPTIMLKRMQLAGHRPIIVVGGATGMIGDPSGRSTERNLLDDVTLQANVDGIHAQLARLLEFNTSPTGAMITNNAEWTKGITYLALRPLLEEYTISMPRGAQVIYPKDAAQILMYTDIFPGARVLEAGVGSGALSLSILRAIGPGGRLYSYERRADFAKVAATNVETFFGRPHPAWDVRVGDLVETIGPEPVDRAILDMLAPWECIDAVGEVLEPGGVLCCYVATTTQLGRTMDTLRVHGGWLEPRGVEVQVRDWHAEGLAIRPGHGGTGHTGFLIHTRRLAPGVTAPLKKRRPAPGAYGPDYQGPRPAGISID